MFPLTEELYYKKQQILQNQIIILNECNVYSNI